MNNAQQLLSNILGVTPIDKKPEGLFGILQTKNYSDFIILNDGGDEIYRFSGAKFANKCLPGDHIKWDGEKCILELRDEHPPIVGTLEFTNKSKYGLTSRGMPIYLFTPYNKSYPNFIVGCSEKDTNKNRIGLIKFSEWDKTSTFPRGQLQNIIGITGDYEAEKDALVWQSSPYRFPKGPYTVTENTTDDIKNRENRKHISGFTFNIDPLGCKDIDDVLTIDRIGDNNWRIIITISDVAHFVKDGDVIDIFASLICQTLYDKTGDVLRPMLPKEYSEDACSLRTNKISYGISLECEWDGNSIINTEWYESYFKTDMSYTYEDFQIVNSQYKEVLYKFSNYLGNEDVNDSHKWIENCMIYYNNEAGKLLKMNNIGILRCHSSPDIDKLKLYENNIPDIKYLAFSSAKYCLAEENNTMHYGLNSNNYTHITSPIRRYADLVNQRCLKNIISKSFEQYIVPLSMYDINYRSKLNKSYIRDLTFLDAINTNSKIFKGMIVERSIKENDRMKLKIYIHEWKRIISSEYLMVNDRTILSRDEKREIDVYDFKDIMIECAFNLRQRNWKDRIIINIL